MSNGYQCNEQEAEALTKCLISFRDNWESYNALKIIGLEAYCKYFYRTGCVERKPNDIKIILDSYAWLPTTRGIKKPCESFIKREEIVEILGDTGSYIIDKLPNKFVETFQIRKNLNFSEMIDILKKDSANQANQFDLYLKIYKKLNTLSNVAEEISIEFAQNRLIYSPSLKKWLKREECVWKNLSGTFYEDFYYISQDEQFKQLKDFFINTIGVKEDADEELYAQQWLKICNSECLFNNFDNLPKIFKGIYNKLYSSITNDQESPGWKSKLMNSAKILTTTNNFISAEKVIFPNFHKAENLFRGEVSIVYVPDNSSKKQWMQFFSKFHVETARNVTKSILMKESNIDNISSNKRFLTECAVQIISTYINEESPTAFSKLYDENIFFRLLQTKEHPVNADLHLTYRLELDREIMEKDDTSVTYLDWTKDPIILYYNNNAKSKDIAYELSRQLAEYLYPDRFDILAFKFESAIGSTDLKRLAADSLKVPIKIKDILKKSNTFSDDTEQSIITENSQYTGLPQDQGIQEEDKLAQKIEKQSNDGDFPCKVVYNPERRTEKNYENMQYSSKRVSEKKLMSQRISKLAKEAETYLRVEYTNIEGVMYCQICKKPMPFKKPINDQYYFECVELFHKDLLNRETEVQYAGLCPLCAAKFKVFIKNDKSKSKKLYNDIENSSNKLEFKIELDKTLHHESTTIRFTEKHLHDLKNLLEFEKIS